MRFESATTDAAAVSSLGTRLEELLAGLAENPGCELGWVACSPDDPRSWVVTSIWRDMGSFRRGLSGFEVKVALGKLAVEAVDQPSVFEIVLSHGRDGLEAHTRDRAVDADVAGPDRS
jgi:hypothetical protein